MLSRFIDKILFPTPLKTAHGRPILYMSDILILVQDVGHFGDEGFALQALHIVQQLQRAPLKRAFDV